MTKTIFSLLLIIMTYIAASQKAEALTGKWKFSDVYNPAQLDSVGLKMARTFFADMSLYLKANNHYKLFMFKKEEGTWSYNETLKKLKLTANRGTISELEIIKATDNSIVLSMGKDRSVILNKTTTDSTDEIEEVVIKPDLVSATKEQICKKWYFKRREMPGKTEEQINLLSELVKGTYFHFRPDNTYEAHILKMKVDEVWQFGSGNKSLILGSGNDKAIWNIKSVSNNELVLIKGNSDEVWKFSDKE